MILLPKFLFPLTCLSFFTAAVNLVIAALVINVTPILWIAPVAFILTLAFHAIFLLMANSEALDALRLYSAVNITASYILSCLWAGVFTICITVTILFKKGTLRNEGTSKMWILILLCVFAFLQTGAMILVAFVLRKERNRLMYMEKWRWRPGALGSSQWSFGQ
ncbi:hypothetical protein BDQ17DRAFT_1299227 [Cyathus striatus]|nr:hypothetical protein BDQ17DRAFT_1299227 [Cyathus striatus]